MPISKRKSQAALEFLTTYGWAFLVILIMMSALAYFGVLNPSKLLPDRCNFGSEIRCNKNLMVINNELPPGNTIVMRLANNFGTSVVVTDAKVATDVITVGTCTVFFDRDGTGAGLDPVDPGSGTPAATFTWNSDETVNLLARCDTGNLLVEKEKVKFGVEINFYPGTAGVAYSKILFGEVFATVQ